MIDPTVEAVIGTFGESVTLRRPTGDVTIRGAFKDQPAPFEIGGVAIEGRASTLLVFASDVLTYGIAVDDRFVVRGAEYKVIPPIEPSDGQAGVELHLK